MNNAQIDVAGNEQIFIPATDVRGLPLYRGGFVLAVRRYPSCVLAGAGRVGKISGRSSFQIVHFINYWISNRERDNKMIGEQTSAIATVLRNKKNAQDFWEKVLNGGQFDLIEKLLGADYTFNGHPSPAAGTAGWLKSIRAAAPDAYFRLESLVGANDTVAVRWTLSATNGGTKTMLTGENVLIFNDEGQCVSNWQSMGTPDFAHVVGN